MSTDTLINLSRKKPSVMWSAGLLFLPISFLWQFFGPNEPIIVSPKTTYITSPLRHNGLPDYEKYLLDSCREGVTPDNNAVSLLWQVVWPKELDPPDLPAICKELGLSEAPPSENRLQSVDSEQVENDLMSWLRQCPRVNADADTADNFLDLASRNPWTNDDAPPLARWVTANSKQLDAIVEATKRPRYYAPSPTLLDAYHDSLISVLQPGVECARRAAFSLAIRAMGRVGSGDIRGAWSDVVAIHRLSRLQAQAPTLVDQFVAISVSRTANEATRAILSQSLVAPDVARLIQRDLQAVPKIENLERTLKMERLALLDAIVHGYSDDCFGIAGHHLFLGASKDWNIALREGNKWHDRLAAAIALPTYAAKRQEIARINADAEEWKRRESGRDVIDVFLDQQNRSEGTASLYVCLMRTKPSRMRQEPIQSCN